MGRATDCSGALYLGLQGFDLSSLGKRIGLRRVPRVPGSGHNKRPRFRGAEENLRRAFMRTAGFITRYLKTWKSTISFPSDQSALSAPTRRVGSPTGRDLPCPAGRLVMTN